MVMRPLISNVSAFHKLLFVCPLICSYPPFSYLKGLLLVQTFFLFTACCDYAFLLFPPSFYSHALFSFAPIPLSFRSCPLFPFVPILVLFRSYPLFCFLPLPLYFRYHPLFSSLLFVFSYFLVALVCPFVCD